jgi:hypothetical protein
MSDGACSRAGGERIGEIADGALGIEPTEGCASDEGMNVWITKHAMGRTATR